MNVAKFLKLTRFEQTIFGLPFIMLAALLPFIEARAIPLSVGRLILVGSAFLFARLSGMAFNQYLDCEIDARNPRTSARPVASGAIPVGQAKLVAWLGLLGFLSICFFLGWSCFCLSLVAATLIWGYSYMKRIHCSCHLVLGCIWALGPIMAYTALVGAPSFAVILLGAAANFSIVGTEIFYAMQDYEFDLAMSLNSIPVKYGLIKSKIIARAFQALSLISFILFGLMLNLGAIFFVGLSLWMFLCYKLSAPSSKSVFSLNAMTGVIILTFTLADILWRV